MMTPPPPQTYLLGAALGWNLVASLLGLPTISGWACRNKKVAVPVAVGGGAWVAIHWALYVYELPD